MPKRRGETGRPRGENVTRLMIGAYAQTKEQFENFAELARRRGQTRSQLLREMIDRELAEAGMGPKESPRASEKPLAQQNGPGGARFGAHSVGRRETWNRNAPSRTQAPAGPRRFPHVSGPIKRPLRASKRKPRRAPANGVSLNFYTSFSGLFRGVSGSETIASHLISTVRSGLVPDFHFLSPKQVHV